MTQDETTYTVTISGPGFSVMAERPGAAARELCDDDVACVLVEAIVLIFGRLREPDMVLASIVQNCIALHGYGEAADERARGCRHALWKAAVELRQEDGRGGV